MGRQSIRKNINTGGVKQECVLSVALFGIYSKTIFEEVLTRVDGVEMGDKCISTIHYADDIMLISDSLRAPQNMVL